jgi:hypothetical protein
MLISSPYLPYITTFHIGIIHSTLVGYDGQEASFVPMCCLKYSNDFIVFMIPVPYSRGNNGEISLPGLKPMNILKCPTCP